MCGRMLTLEANAIAEEAFRFSLRLLEREMQVILQHLNNLATEAALIAGFVFVVHSGGVTVDSLHPLVAVLAMASATACLGAMMYVVVSATIACSQGPESALKVRANAASESEPRRIYS